MIIVIASILLKISFLAQAKFDNCQWNDHGVVYDLASLKKPENY